MKPANTNDPPASVTLAPMAQDKSFLLRLSFEELTAWKAAAEADGRSLASWIRQQCNLSLRKSMGVKPPRKARR